MAEAVAVVGFRRSWGLMTSRPCLRRDAAVAAAGSSSTGTRRTRWRRCRTLTVVTVGDSHAKRVCEALELEVRNMTLQQLPPRST